MRLFLAIPLPPEVISYVKDLQQHLQQPGIVLASKPDLTLHFIGTVENRDLDELKRQLSLIKQQHFIITTHIPDFFPSHRYIRVSYIHVKPDAPLKKLRRQIMNLRFFEHTIDKMSYVPHITLARVKFIDDREALKKQVNNLPLREISFHVDRFVLMKSELREHGSQHTEIAAYPLENK